MNVANKWQGNMSDRNEFNLSVKANLNASIDERARIYFMGIGGIGMSALAIFMNRYGYHVSGSDSNTAGYVIDDLEVDFP